jgi:hypothetical protein
LKISPQSVPPISEQSEPVISLKVSQKLKKKEEKSSFLPVCHFGKSEPKVNEFAIGKRAPHSFIWPAVSVSAN